MLLFFYELNPCRRFIVKTIFCRSYYIRAFGGKESVSGSGSDLAQTTIVRTEIRKLIKEFGIKVLLDAPCGDFYWMRYANIDVERYIGIDIVPEIIAVNQRYNSDKNRVFMTGDIMSESLPKADLILCRDHLVHFSIKDIFSTLRNFKKSSATYLLATTYVNHMQNANIITGEWRPLNLELSPFNFPKPIALIMEERSLVAKRHKKDIKLFGYKF